MWFSPQNKKTLDQIFIVNFFTVRKMALVISRRTMDFFEVSQREKGLIAMQAPLKLARRLIQLETTMANSHKRFFFMGSRYFFQEKPFFFSSPAKSLSEGKRSYFTGKKRAPEEEPFSQIRG
jgi:hypothetical protein